MKSCVVSLQIREPCIQDALDADGSKKRIHLSPRSKGYGPPCIWSTDRKEGSARSIIASYAVPSNLDQIASRPIPQTLPQTLVVLVMVLDWPVARQLVVGQRQNEVAEITDLRKTLRDQTNGTKGENEGKPGRSYKSTTWCLDWDKGFGNGQMAYGVFTCCASPEAGSLVPFVSILTSFRCHKVGLKNLSLRF